MEPSGLMAVVITVSDSVSASTRQDASGPAIARRLEELGFRVETTFVPDETARIAEALRSASVRAALVVTTGGTGLTPRDVTPQATKSVVEYEIPGFGELIRAEGGARTKMAYLSRGIAGVLGACLIVNVPGSPRGALESLAAIEPVLGHALETIAGPFDHDTRS